jgi:hypothetical protein
MFSLKSVLFTVIILSYFCFTHSLSNENQVVRIDVWYLTEYAQNLKTEENI